MTGILSASSAHAVRRNAAMLPAYSLMLGMLILFGFFVIAAGIDKLPEFAPGFAQFKANFAAPAILLWAFPSWFVGIAFAAIGIGALVPAAIMSIAAANLYTRNIHREFFNPALAGRDEAQIAKWVSLIVKFGALIFVLFLPLQYAIQLQFLGGVWIVQTFPAVILGLFTRKLNDWALLCGWLAGTAIGTWMAVVMNFGATYPLTVGGWTVPGYSAFYTVILNLVVALVLTPVFNAIAKPPVDETVLGDYVV
jgi:SSS family solute:Na+ symporter